MFYNILKINPIEVRIIADGYTAMLSTVNQFILMGYFAVNHLLMQHIQQTWRRHVLIYTLTTLIY